MNEKEKFGIMIFIVLIIVVILVSIKAVRLWV